MALLWLVAFEISAPVPAVPPPTTGHVTGRVTDPAGKPVSGAAVYLSQYGRRGTATTTGADGRFRLGPVSPGLQRSLLCVDAEGYGRQVISAPVVFAGRDSDAGDIGTTPGVRYAGRVTDPAGNPIPGARVVCELERLVEYDTVSHIGPPHELVTDGDGRYATPPLPACVVQITARHPERVNGFAKIIVDPGGDGRIPVVKLDKDVPYTGKVVDEAGKPVAGAVIGGYAGLAERTDADGRFTIRGHGRRRAAFTLNAQKDGHTYTTFEMTTENPTVVLRTAGVFAGTVTDADTGVAVRLSRVTRAEAGKPAASAVVRQPESGTFRVEFPDPGEWTLTFHAEGYEPAVVTAPKADAIKTVGGLTVKMKRWATKAGPDQMVRGTATEGGKPVPLGWAVAYRLAPSQGYQSCEVRRGRAVGTKMHVYVQAEAPVRDGRFELPVRDPGDDWYVAVHAPDSAPAVLGPLAIKPRERLRLAVVLPAAGSVEGKADVPAAWAGHAWVVAFSRNGYRAEARVGADGRYHFARLPPGDYGLKVGHDAFADEEVTAEKEHRTPADPWKRAVGVTVTDGKAVGGIDLSLPEK